MIDWLVGELRRRWRLLLSVFLLGGYWLLPISGQITVSSGPASQPPLWPQVRLAPSPPAPGEETTVLVTDDVPWVHVALTVDGQPATYEGVDIGPGDIYTWRWRYRMPARAAGDRPVSIAFYRDCDLGCVERARVLTGGSTRAHEAEPAAPAIAGKLGLVLADPERDWHGRAGWDVEIAYTRLADQKSYWDVDSLAARVNRAAAEGLRVLVRVEYDFGQSLPPPENQPGLAEYLRYLRRLARDDRLDGVYGYVIGSSFNAKDANAQALEQPVTPAWYARVFNGYGESTAARDNVLDTIRAENPNARVLVGPVRPWTGDQNGERGANPDVPWLNYMNGLVAALDESARARAAAGVALGAPDGFALQAPGRVDAVELAGRDPATEPLLDLRREAWGDAQAGFRVYRDWLAIVNAYPSTRGLPAYITATNTFVPDEGIPPAQNYPRGWLTNALREIEAQPQVMSLIWYLDGPLDDAQWDSFSLAKRPGHLSEAADEFDALLQGER